MRGFQQVPMGMNFLLDNIIRITKGLEKRVLKHVEKKEEKENATYEAYALVMSPYVFQIWAYEVILLLGMKYTNHIYRNFPIILN